MIEVIQNIFRFVIVLAIGAVLFEPDGKSILDNYEKILKNAVNASKEAINTVEKLVTGRYHPAQSETTKSSKARSLVDKKRLSESTDRQHTNKHAQSQSSQQYSLKPQLDFSGYKNMPELKPLPKLNTDQWLTECTHLANSNHKKSDLCDD